MYASLRKYRVNPEHLDELTRRVDEVFAPRLENMEGFVAYELIDGGDGTIVSCTMCHDEEACERSVDLAAEFVGDELDDLEIERLEIINGAVTVSRAIAEVLEPTHA